MKNNTLVSYSEFGLSEEEASNIVKGLGTIISERETLEEQYEIIVRKEITPELSKEAGELRKLVRDNRTKGIVKWHKANKDYFLQGGRFVDAIKNKNIIHNEMMEEKLLSIEKYEENLEKERKAKLAEKRLSEVKKYLSENDLQGVDLGEMSDLMFDGFKKQAILSHEERIEEEKRKEEEAENERKRILAIEKENKRLELELKSRLEAEEKQKKEKLAKEKEEAEKLEKLKKAPLKQKLSFWLSEFKHPENTNDSEIQEEILEKFEGFITWASKKINNL